MLSSQYFCTYFPRTHHHTSLELTTTRVPPLGAMLGHLSHGLSGLSLSAQPKPTELEEAVKYGRCEKANPGRDGKPRHRYIHKGTIFITDETSKHEITSWRMESAGDNDEENEHADIRSEAGTLVLILWNSWVCSCSRVCNSTDFLLLHLPQDLGHILSS